MTEKEAHSCPEADFRKRAEETVRETAAQSPGYLEAPSPEEARQLLHELQAHKIELEMQNEELRRAQTETEASRERYSNLYDLAPVGYVTVSEEGLILEANLTAANLLGVPRDALVKQPITQLILPEDQDIYYLRRKQLFETGGPQACEFRMLRADAGPFWVRFAMVVAQDSEGASRCRAVMSDITERKRSEEALRESQSELRALYDGTPVMMCSLDAERCVISANRAFIEASGWPDTELNSDRACGALGCVFALDDPAGCGHGPRCRSCALRLALMDTAQTGIAHHNIEYPTVLQRNGRREEVVLLGSTTRMISASRNCTLLCLQDITERKRAEERLRIKNLVFDVSLAANSFADHNGVITEANDTFLRIWDHQSKDEVVGKPIAHFFNDPNEAVAIVTALDGTSQWKGSFIAKKKDGSTFFAQGLATIVRDENGKAIGYQSSVLDITEQTRSEIELRKFKTISDCSPHGHAIIDLEGNVLYVNTAFARMHGYEPEEFACRHISDFHTPEQIPGVNRLFERLKRDGQFADEEVWHKRLDGSVFPTLMNAVVISGDKGTPLFLSGMALDITERKRAEEELALYRDRLERLVEERTAELVAANQALKSEAARRSAMEDELRHRRTQFAQVSRLNLVGGMAAGLAHELNQPLTAIQTYATCSLERIRLGASPLDDLRGDLEKIIQQTGRASEVVRHIRRFIRNQESHQSTTDVNGVVQNAISLVSHEIAWRGIRLEVHLADSLPLTVADPVQVEQVVLNLVQNAIEAMTGGGVADSVLTVTTSVFPDNSIQVAIADRGPGLAAEVAARLFEPFVTTKEGGLGLGLGLSICQTIVESHNGRLWASPNPQGGTTFVFSLPIQGVET